MHKNIFNIKIDNKKLKGSNMKLSLIFIFY